MANPKDLVKYVDLVLNLQEYFATVKTTVAQLAKEIDAVKTQTLLLSEQVTTLRRGVETNNDTDSIYQLRQEAALLKADLAGLRNDVERGSASERLSSLDKQVAVLYNELSHLRERVVGIDPNRLMRVAEPPNATLRLPDAT